MAVTSHPELGRAIRHLRDPESLQVGPKRLIDYPRAGRRGIRRWIPSWKLALGASALGFAGIVMGLMVAYAKTPIPTANSNVKDQKTVVYWASDNGKTRGTQELGRFGDVDRRIVTGKAIPQVVKDAVVAAEDRSFYTNKSGISPTGILRAAWTNARGGSLQGGSTITQQYVKNYFLESDRTMSRKAKEFFISVKVAREASKDEIMENYLNTIYWGRNTYGIEAAARAYFGRSAKDLTPSQAAFLAGIINGPELSDPHDGDDERERAEIRWNYVLDGMEKMGTLAPEDRPAKFPKVIKQRPGNSLSGQTGYLMRMVEKELLARGYSPEEIKTGGLKVYTTFDKKLVQAGVEAVKTFLPDPPDRVQVAMASVDVETGAVKAIYGGHDYIKRSRNAATEDTAMAGSTFKPFCLVAALDNGISLKSRFSGASPLYLPKSDYPKPVRNFDNHPYGFLDLPAATANSVNTVYMQLNKEVGPKKTREAAVKAGIPSDTSGFDNGLGNVLGSADVRPIDMASAYATFAGQGVRREHYIIEVVDTPDKKNSYVHGRSTEDAKEKQAFDREVMADTVYAMQQVVTRGSGGYARSLGRPVAGKTGTSQESQSAWFVGFTPQVSTAVAMYRLGKNDKGQDVLPPMGPYRTITGSSYPVRIWTEYMQKAVEGMPIEQFPEPAWVGVPQNPMPTLTTTQQTPTTTLPTWTLTPTGRPTETGRPTWPTQTTAEPTTTTTERTPDPTQTTTTRRGGGGGD